METAQRQASKKQAWAYNSCEVEAAFETQRKGIDYNSEDYSSSDEDSSVSEVVSEVEPQEILTL